MDQVIRNIHLKVYALAKAKWLTDANEDRGYDARLYADGKLAGALELAESMGIDVCKDVSDAKRYIESGRM